MKMTEMNGAVVTALGCPPKYQPFTIPTLSGGETLVKVSASSLKQLDRAIVAGSHYASPTPTTLPIICGTDGVGIYRDERVYFQTTSAKFGAMADYAPASLTISLPHQLDDNFVAALMNPAIGAWLPIAWRGQMTKGETVLVLGATGDTGKQALAIAKLLGAKMVIAAGRQKSGLMDLNADAYIDTDQDDGALFAELQRVATHGVDLIVDYLWGKPAELMIRALMTKKLTIDDKGAERGIRFVSVGALAGAEISLPSTIFRSSFLTILGSGTGNFPPAPLLKNVIESILQEALHGNLTIDYQAHPLSAVEKLWPHSSKQRIVFNP